MWFLFTEQTTCLSKSVRYLWSHDALTCLKQLGGAGTDDVSFKYSSHEKHSVTAAEEHTSSHADLRSAFQDRECVSLPLTGPGPVRDMLLPALSFLLSLWSAEERQQAHVWEGSVECVHHHHSTVSSHSLTLVHYNTIIFTQTDLLMCSAEELKSYLFWNNIKSSKWWQNCLVLLIHTVVCVCVCVSPFSTVRPMLTINSDEILKRSERSTCDTHRFTQICQINTYNHSSAFLKTYTFYFSKAKATFLIFSSFKLKY